LYFSNYTPYYGQPAFLFLKIRVKYKNLEEDTLKKLVLDLILTRRFIVNDFDSVKGSE